MTTGSAGVFFYNNTILTETTLLRPFTDAYEAHDERLAYSYRVGTSS